jgi:hypothetical protein
MKAAPDSNREKVGFVGLSDKRQAPQPPPPADGG